jgi:hypothetical protein
MPSVRIKGDIEKFRIGLQCATNRRDDSAFGQQSDACFQNLQPQRMGENLTS